MHGGMTTALAYKNITLFILFGVKASVGVWERRRRMETATLTNNFLSWPHHTVLSSRTHLALLIFSREYSTGGSVRCCRNGAPSHSIALLWLTEFLWPQAETDSRLRLTLPVSLVGIWIHHFITPTHFRSTTWLLPLFFTCAYCAENLWLTALSRVNMQYAFICQPPKEQQKLNHEICNIYIYIYI